MNNQLDVYLYGNLIGKLFLHSGSMRFEYENDAKHFLSLNMPVRMEPYSSKACEAYFGGLLPEGEKLLKAIARNTGANSRSTYSLLEQTGRDCAGAVQVCTPGQSADIQTTFELQGESLSEERLAKLLTELPTRPLFIQDEFRLSLAGAQDKGALCLIDGKLAIPKSGVPTTHILKPSIKHSETPDTVENEYFCMKLAQLAGLKMASVEVRNAENIKYLLVTRFDRTDYLKSYSKKISRVHQEDFCQALGVVSTKKYEADGGPSLIKCFQLAEKLAFPARDKIELLKRVVFNFIIGNGDCHSKNFSILHYSNNISELSPGYDVLSSIVYPKLSTKFAMSIGREAEMNSIRFENWARFINQINVNAKPFKDLALELSNKIAKHIPPLKEQMMEEHIWSPICDDISEVIHHRSEMLKLSLKHIS